MSPTMPTAIADELSGGERQRVAIARAIVGERGLLLADEPTGALDSVNGEAVMRLLRAATQRGVAGVVVTHEAHLASWADRVVFLRDGHVVDQTVAPPGPESLLAAGRPAMTTLAHRSALRRAGERRRRCPPRARPLGVAPVPPRVAPADPGARPPHRRGRGRDRQRHDRLQLRRRRRCRVRLGQPPAPVRRRRSASARGGSRLRRGVRSGRSTSSATARCAVPGGVDKVEFRAQDPRGAYGGALLALRRGSYPDGPAPGRGHRRRGRPPRARARGDAGPRRPPADRRRHRREPTRSERRVRPRLPRVRGGAGPRHGARRRRAPSRSTRSSTRVRERGRSALVRVRGSGERPGGRTRWRCSRWPPSSCSWPRWSPPQASPSSRSDGSASSACSRRSARPRSTSDSCC